jgi:polysaccharide pyruvyl transferase WcaK-like protein
VKKQRIARSTKLGGCVENRRDKDKEEKEQIIMKKLSKMQILRDRKEITAAAVP